MNGLEDASRRTQRAIVAGIVAYFLIFGVAVVSGDPRAYLAAGVVFGVIAVGVGVVLARISGDGRQRRVLLGAAGCLVAGGLLQFAFLATVLVGASTHVIDDLSSLLVFAGIGLYIYATWYGS